MSQTRENSNGKFDGMCCKCVTFVIKALNYISAMGKMCVSFCLDDIEFDGGCAANLKAIARLMNGRMIYGRRMAFFDDIECEKKARRVLRSSRSA